MNRRDTLQKLMLASVGLITLPAWAKEWSVSALTAHHSSFSFGEQGVLSAVVDTIIPAGDSIGALSVGTDRFLQKLLDDCYEKDVQENVKSQLNGLEISAQATFQKSFGGCTSAQRQELLLKLAGSENKMEKDFFDLIKSETIRGFNTSKEVMTTYLHYRVAPGHYYGCVDVKA